MINIEKRILYITISQYGFGMGGYRSQKNLTHCTHYYDYFLSQKTVKCWAKYLTVYKIKMVSAYTPPQHLETLCNSINAKDLNIRTRTLINQHDIQKRRYGSTTSTITIPLRFQTLLCALIQKLCSTPITCQ